MITLNKEIFDSVFEEYKKIDVPVEYTRNGSLRLPYNVTQIYNLFYLYKLSLRNMKKIIDWSLKDGKDMKEVIKLCCIFSEKDLMKRNITLETYEYFLSKFSSLENIHEYEDLLYDVVYFRLRDYDGDSVLKRYDKKINALMDLTVKYLDNFNITKEEIITNFSNSYTNDYDYQYRGYKNQYDFNKYLDELAGRIPINPEDFKIEDNIEDFLWKEKTENH